MRFTEKMVAAIGKFHCPPEKDLCVVTHIEHTYEVTPDMVEAVQRLRKQGIAVYNQQVFTMENSRKFETAALRMTLKQIGVDPYYTFNTKGKKEQLVPRADRATAPGEQGGGEDDPGPVAHR